MRDEDDGEAWKLEYVMRDMAPVLEAFAKYGPRFAVLQGHEVVECADLSTWARMFEVGDRIVAQTTVNQYFISTVFLGLNHALFRRAAPEWFETMVFERGEGEEDKVKSDRFLRRYGTWEEAEAGHAEMVEIIRYGNF